MSSPDPGSRIRRVAVALDASPHAIDRLELAAAIAAALHAELEGVYVEDTELLRLAGLPFLRELRVATLCESALDAERLERELRAVGRRVRERLEQTASGLGVTWTFRVWRGDLEAEILAAAHDAELFALGRLGRFAPLRRRPRPSPPRAAGAGLIVGVLCTRAEELERLLSVATLIAGRRVGGLTIILQPETSEDALTLRAHALQQLGPLGDLTRLIALDPAGASTAGDALDQTIRALGIDLLILGSGHPLLTRASLWPSLERLSCPMLIGR
jgi:nucleotide-binding universal stress UspA family protein